MADEEQTPPAKPDRIYDRTTDRVAGMSDEARAALHRKIHGGKETVPDKGFRTPTGLQYGPGRPAGDTPDPSAEVIRLEAELHRTERRIERIRFPSGDCAHGEHVQRNGKKSSRLRQRKLP